MDYTCFRMSKKDAEMGIKSAYSRCCIERDKLDMVAPGFLDALREKDIQLSR